MLEVGEVVGQRLDDGRVQRAVHAVVRGAQVLGTCWGGSVEMYFVSVINKGTYHILLQLYGHNHAARRLVWIQT